ncbi:MAG: hypothetical protein HY574_08975 [candidate division NC10 bacterium]|nr:hypothetical protein [candidate division NC10 bacterium]
MKRISDELLEYYAELFIERRVRDQGVTFERFLDLPEAYLTRTSPSRRERNPLTFLLLAAATLFAACGKASDVEAIASRFVDQYYVKVDLTRAKQLTDGLATRKIEQEEALLQGSSGGRAGTAQRDVTYRLLEKREEGEHLFFVYDLNITGQGVPTLKKRSVLSAGKRDGAWRITNFRDFDS